jgi:predicted AAA+ superfamily ATPase
MIKRTLESTLKKAAAKYPVITLTGPRQSGKTTLVRMAFPKHDYVSLEDPDLNAYALEDPRGFLDQFRGKTILDEVQRVPSLFSYIQTIVDSEQASGRFILTGSQNFLLLKKISQSLAGRCAVLHLLPFSLSELEGRKSFPLSKIGRELPRAKRQSRRHVMEVLFSGFYPRIHDQGMDPRDWLANYYRTYVERDVREIVNIGDMESFGRFVRLCAGRNGQILNMSSLANDCGVTHTTVKRWISILEASFLTILLRPHYKNFSKRLIKSPKIYFLDSGLLCFLLRIRAPDDLRFHALRGNIFETFVISEFIKNYLNQGEDPGIYFWRDSGGHEIDVLIEMGNELKLIEIKSGQTVSEDFFDGIEYWRSLSGNSEVASAIIYGGDRSYRRKGTILYSWSCL